MSKELIKEAETWVESCSERTYELELIQDLLAALKEKEQARWLPISEAPAAEVILVAIPFDEQTGGYYYHCAAYWGGRWRVAGTKTSRVPTHFQYLSTPPEGE
jgi:hypothetical protein